MDSFDFTAGQFVQLDLPIHTEVTRRSYSISSPPEGTNRIQLCVALLPGGAGSTYLFNEAKPGTILKCSQSLGRFVLPEIVEEETCFISTGVGVAPFRSILMDAFRRGIVRNKIHLFFGNRRRQDILYRDEWEQMAREHPEFRFHPVLSREQAPEWDGFTGYVHPWYRKEFADKRKAKFYLCGWREMLDDARANLKDMGYSHRDVKVELYT